MPFIPHTPESLLVRSDSRDPATTCNGITSAGRPCRRALATSPRSSPSPRASPSAIGRVLAVVHPDSQERANVEAAVFFCWQHKEQAEKLGADGGSARVRQGKRVVEMRERTSVDTLVDRLGLLEVGDGSPIKAKGRGHRVSRREAGLEKRESGLGVSSTAIEHNERIGSAKPGAPPLKARRKSRREGNLIVSLFCCVRSVDPEYMPPARPRPQSYTSQGPRASRPPTKDAPPARRSDANGLLNAKAEKPESMTPDRGGASHQPAAPSATRLATARVSLPRKTPHLNNRPAFHDPPSQTTTLLSLIPTTLPPHTTSALLSELAKPLPASSDDDGYIYIFWLTDTASTPPPSPQTAASFLQTPPRPHRHRPHNSDPLSNPACTGPNGTKTLLLKIGRASNVHRRLNEWSRQCGYALSLVRYYPYLPSSSSSVNTSATAHSHPHAQPASAPVPRTPRKVPHVSRVERLIHIELADRRVRRQCKVCGRGHREWFEVEASREGVRGVDEVVGRWVSWGEGRRGAGVG